MNDLVTPGTWAVGEYTLTETFKQIRHHTCIYQEETGMLIAITGPMGDPASQADAELMATARIMAESLQELTEKIAELEKEAESERCWANHYQTKAEEANRMYFEEQARANAYGEALQEVKEALLAIQNAITNGDLTLTWKKKRQSDSDPYHPANIQMCAAIRKVEDLLNPTGDPK